MSKKKAKLRLEWKSKFIDLLIVIIGITIAFKVNTWAESKKTALDVNSYITSFYSENKINNAAIISAIEYTKQSKSNIDTLKSILLNKKYNDPRIKNLSASLMGMASFKPTTTTMENILASGEFEMIQNITLREKLISTYNYYDTAIILEEILNSYINEYITPFFFENVRFSDFSSINSNFIENPMFENIVFGFDVLLQQEINGYQEALEKIQELNTELENNNLD